MLSLPNVSLVMVETRLHELARLTLKEAVSKVRFASVHVYTDDLCKFDISGIQYFTVPDWQTKRECLDFCSFDSFQNVKTSHVLFMEWDSGVVDERAWRDEFLQYDFIGSPWNYTENNVGNGGFSLRSKRMMDYLSANRSEFPTYTDDLLCRVYRPKLELAGFEWAPDGIAHDFSFEWVRPSHRHRHFGYHGMFNWPLALSPEDLKVRFKAAAQSEYIRNSAMWQQTLDVAPWLKEVA